MVSTENVRWRSRCRIGVFLTSMLVATTLAAQERSPIITYRLADGGVYRIEAQNGALPENLSLEIDERWPGSGEIAWINPSPDGSWFLVETERFDPTCAGWACLALLRADLSAFESVQVGGQVIHTEGFAAVGPSGQSIVYSAGDGPHVLDLWLIERTIEGWQGPQLLSAGSLYEYNSHPAIAADQRSVVFDCGPVPYGQQGTALCEVDLENAAVMLLLSPSQLPPAAAFHHPDYAPDGSIVFEADPNGEQIWRLPRDGDPELVGIGFDNDNSPCVLPDGRIVSLWLGREGGDSEHELKVMAADGSEDVMLLTGVDVMDIGIGCGASPRQLPPPRRASGRAGSR